MDCDLAVVGSGFGGLSLALAAARRGLSVELFETLKYPGGCAGTFTKKGYRFDAGATLVSGLRPEDPLGSWVTQYAPELALSPLDPVVEVRTPEFQLSIPAQRQAFVAEILAQSRPRARDGLARFLDFQGRVADYLWGFLEDPRALPPFHLREALAAAPRALRGVFLLPWLGRSLEDVLVHFGVAQEEPLRSHLEALCQITVQCPPQEAEAVVALSVMDYYFRGVREVPGGVGKLAEALVRGIEAEGSKVSLAHRVRSLEPCPGGYRIEHRSGVLRARNLAFNGLPEALPELYRGELPAWLETLTQGVRSGWSACMLYLVCEDSEDLPASGGHFDLTRDPRDLRIRGNHVFVSVSSRGDRGRAPAGERTVGVSTHLPAADFLERSKDQIQGSVEACQASMQDTLAKLLPEWASRIRVRFPASPRTFARFTGRPHGLVGGIPRRVGRDAFRGVFGSGIGTGFYLVGDTVFPGASVQATALGGYHLGLQIADKMGAGSG